MNAALELALIMRSRDQASPGVAKVHQALQKTLRDTDKGTAALTRTMLGYERQTQSAKRGTDALIASMRNVARERGPTAFVSALVAVERAAQRARQALVAALQAGQKLSTVAAGVGAAGYVVSRPAGAAMDYNLRLANMSNTAFADRNTAGRQAGKRELDAAIARAVRGGGGSRDSAAEALDTLIASGAMSPDDAMAMLPTLVKASTAANADPSQLAQIGIRGMQTFGLKPSDLAKTFDMAITAGQAGGFELKDMAKWLPQQMAAARLSGLSGMGGMAKLLAANQASAITAGTKDAAGNNLTNLLAKINSQDTAKDAAKLGINLSGTLAKARGKGMDSIDAFVGIVDHVVGQDKEFQALKRKAAATTGTEQHATFEAQRDILQGSSIGKIVQDREALMALVALMNNRSYMDDVERKTRNGSGATDANYAVIAAEPAFKVQQAQNEAAIANTAAFEHLTPLIGTAADGFTDLAQKHPDLAASAVAATTALTALAAAAGAAGLVNLFKPNPNAPVATSGRGIIGRILGTGVASAATDALGVPLAAAAGSATGIGTLGSIGLGALPLGVMGGVTAWVGDTSHDAERTQSLLGLSKFLSGFFGDSTKDAVERYKAQQLELNPREIKVTVDVKNGNIVAAVNQENARSGRQH